MLEGGNVLAQDVIDLDEEDEEVDEAPAGPVVQAGAVIAVQVAFYIFIAFVVAYAVIAWFMRYISTRSFMPFVIYRVLLGILIFVLVATGVLTPSEGATSGGVSSG